MSHETPVTLITGTRKGIGKSLALHYLEKGHRVIGCSRGPTEIAHQNFRSVQLDVANEAQVTELFRGISKQEGRLDHLINNAGIASMNHSLLTPASTVQNILATNVLGPFLFCREAARLMQKKKVGRIVNFSTVAVPLSLEGEAAYAASKAAVETLTKVLAKEFSSFGITVNAVGPTPVETDLIRAVPKKKIDELIQKQTLHRMGTIDDVINVVDFFLQEKSQFVTAQVLYLGGL